MRKGGGCEAGRDDQRRGERDEVSGQCEQVCGQWVWPRWKGSWRKRSHRLRPSRSVLVVDDFDSLQLWGETASLKTGWAVDNEAQKIGWAVVKNTVLVVDESKIVRWMNNHRLGLRGGPRTFERRAR